MVQGRPGIRIGEDRPANYTPDDIRARTAQLGAVVVCAMPGFARLSRTWPKHANAASQEEVICGHLTPGPVASPQTRSCVGTNNKRLGAFVAADRGPTDAGPAGNASLANNCVVTVPPAHESPLCLRNLRTLIVLEHIIVPARDKEASARFIADLLGLEYLGLGSTAGPPAFARVQVGATTLDFADAQTFGTGHYAFQVDDQRLDAILARVRDAGLPFYADPRHEREGELNNWNGGRGFYFSDPNDGHSIELLTHPA